MNQVNTVEVNSRMRVVISVLLPVLLGNWFPSIVCRADDIKPADLVVQDGRIVTADRAFRVVEAMAIRAGRIVRVGSNHDVCNLVTDMMYAPLGMAL